jgi:Rps23 Pro-64 3,4-dihydroxylase Tpa1-like proline 4-hydroxylase
VPITSRIEIADLAVRRLADGLEETIKAWATSGEIRHVVVDNLLPEELAYRISETFPPHDRMILKKSLREHKYVGVQMDQYDPLAEEAIYAFQDPTMVDAVRRITEISDLLPDEDLYVGGLSSMGRGQFLNPHIDNSHDKDRDHWRALNLLYYVSPDWQLEDGGNLELWPSGIGRPQVTLWSRFNRLIIMETHAGSWHSVSPITVNRARRCISNYYFSSSPVRARDRFHVTSFRARPGDRARDLALQVDTILRMGLRQLRPKGIRKNPHIYKRPNG